MDRPILFKGEMVKALLAGRKTQTRRVIDFKGIEQAPGRKGEFYFRDRKDRWVNATAAAMIAEYCPYGQAGDRLWVRETWRAEEFGEYGVDGVRYRADDFFREIENTQAAADLWMEAHREGDAWRPSIYMPRWASRIMLDVVNIRVERVQEITDADARAEGITVQFPNRGEQCWTHKTAYARLWDEINDARGFGWDVNPWVWVVEFKRL